MNVQGRAVAYRNNKELLEALIAGRKEIRDVFIVMDRCFEEATDALRENPNADPDELELSAIAIQAGCMEHALGVLMKHLAGYEGNESDRGE